MSKIVPFPSPDSGNNPNIRSTENPNAPHLDSEMGVPTDLEARAQALDTRISCIVEAPAGSGKTGLLMQRYLKLLTEPSVEQPEEVLAITFTNKATAELRERIVAELQKAHNPQNPPPSDPFEQATHSLAIAALARSTDLQWNILDRPQRLNIRTIDSICAQIANALPLLSGSGGSQSPTVDARPLYRLAAERTLLQLGSSDPILHDALRNVLLHRDGNLADVEDLLADMLANREQWGEIIPLTPGERSNEYLDTEVRPKLERALESIVCAALTRAENLMPPGMLRDLTTLAADFGLNPGYNNTDNPIAFCTALRQPPTAAAAYLDHWHALLLLLLTKDGWRKPRGINSRNIQFEIDKAGKSDLGTLIESHQSDDLLEALQAVRNLPPARYPEDQWEVTRSLFHVLRRALAELKLLFAERSTCDFTELAIEARQALADPLDSTDDDAADLALTPGGRLRHLLVDEMQDTSAAQYDLIHLLTRTWDGATQTLFLVGDPKQSIYLFRQARVERFLRTMREHRLGDIPLIPVRLTTNFRSQAALVHDFNRTFEQLFPSPEEAARTHNTSDVPFVAATPNRETTEFLSIQWHPALKSPENKQAHEQQQARDITGTVAHWLREPLPANRTKQWRIAILARNRSHLIAIVRELKQAKIPYKAVDIDALATRIEVLDALALTRALLHPADRVAWLAVLHAPWCGLSLTDLLALTTHADDFTPIPTLITNRREHLSPEGQRLLDRAWPTLSASLSTLGTAPIATHVERTWRSLGGDAILTPTERTNVLRFLDILREVAADSTFVDLAVLESRLDALYAEPQDSNVELLTIHKAKGLEWDVVLVPNLERMSGANMPDLLNWLEIDTTVPDASPILLAPIASKGTKTADLNKWLNSAKKIREAAERKRLFYVLATRAKEELHLFGAVELKQNGELKQPRHGSLLQSIWPAAESEFLTLLSSKLPNESLTPESEADEQETYEPEPLALAASATPHPPPQIQRLPADFDPLARFTSAAAHKLDYTPASALRHAPSFSRPEGSFAVRAFGNVVHRYLQLLSARLADSTDAITPVALLAELPLWQPRLLASLRGEGLAPSLAQQDATRALAALTQSLHDPIGRWILSPQLAAANELPLAFASPLAPTLRVDRTFLAAAQPQLAGDTHRWIVDFKTGTQRGLTPEAFEAEERSKYSAQLSTYAAAERGLNPNSKPILLALYYPLIPRLLFWPAE